MSRTLVDQAVISPLVVMRNANGFIVLDEHSCSIRKGGSASIEFFAGYWQG